MKNKENRLVIVGAGGHGKVVADAVIKQGVYNLVGFIDDQLEVGTTVFKNEKVIGKLSDTENLKGIADHFIVAIGNNEIRAKIYDHLIKYLKPATVIHPASTLAEKVNIGKGCMLLAGCVIGYNAQINENSIINTMALVDHDSIIEQHSHVAQGAIVGSIVKLPSFYTVQLGEVVKSYTIIEKERI